MTHYHNLNRENNTLTDAQVDNVKAVYHTKRKIMGVGCENGIDSTSFEQFYLSIHRKGFTFVFECLSRFVHC